MTEKFIIRGMADVEAIEKVPLADRLKTMNTYQLLEQGAKIDPKARAISFMFNGDSFDQPVTVNYGQFIGRVRQAANMFYDLGVRSTDVVTYILPNAPQTHFTLWGAEVAGIANPVNPLLEAETIADICRAAGTKVLVALGDLPGTEIWKKVEAIKDRIPSLEHVLQVMGPGDSDKGILSFDAKIEEYPGDSLIFDRDIQPGDIASIYHTGGTTGRPKLARRTHYNEVAACWDLMAAAGINPGEAVLVGLPLFHCNGTIVTGLLPFSMGGHVVMLSPQGYRDPSVIKNFYKIVNHYKPVFFSAVPTVLSMLLDVPVGDADISSLRYAICGAAPLSVELFKRFEDRTGMKILEGYGLTEVAVASTVNPKDGERKVGSIGIRLPYQEVKVLILDEEGQYVRDAGVNEIGTICIKGPCVFKGYVEEEHNRNIWVKNGWFNTGDLGRMDEDGYFYLTGRKKDLIIRGGHNIDPITIEEPLYKLPEVKTVAAVSRPDGYAGEVPVVYVELVQGAKISAEEIKQWARENIGERAAVPKEVVVVNQIPLTPVGKVFKPALRWDAAKRVYEQELQKLGNLVESLEVQVGDDKLHGTKVTIKVKPAPGRTQEEVEKKIAETLASYPLHFVVRFV